MEKLLYIATSPIILLLIYVYIKDKYEKEPKLLAMICFMYGLIITVPIIFTENLLENLAPVENTINYLFFKSFIVAAFVEETYKYIILYFIIYKNKNFNEPFDGILYAVFISLGFAFIENIIYVLNPQIGGVNTGILRGVFSVPAHFIFAVYMGYYLSKYKFINRQIKNLILAYFVPISIHGVYDILLLLKSDCFKILFLIFFVIIMINSLFLMRKYIKNSPFKKK